jgi:hypothetical protein
MKLAEAATVASRGQGKAVEARQGGAWQGGAVEAGIGEAGHGVAVVL